MEIDKFLEWIKKLDSKKKGKEEDFEKLQRFFERFHLLNRAYLDKETFEKARSPSHPWQRLLLTPFII